MKTFVTGGTGFIGSHVVDLLLENGHAVRILSRRSDLPEQWKGKDVAAVPGDLRDPHTVIGHLKGTDVVFHIGEIRNTSAVNAARNVEAVKRMAGELKEAEVKRLVFISSLTVAGIPGTVPATEETEASHELRGSYTEYKRAAETIIRDTAGVEHVILRPGIVYGPRSKNLSRAVLLLKKLGLFGIPFIGTGKNRAPFIEVRDLASAIYLAGTRPEAANQTLNMTDGRPHTWRDFFNAFPAAVGGPVRIIPVPPFLFRPPAALIGLLSGPFGLSLDLNSYVTYLSRDVHFSSEKAKAVLGWKPEYENLRDAVRDMVEWYAQKEGGR